MRISSILIMLVLSLKMFAQIGINTDKPFSGLILHVDPKNNTLSTSISTQSDDLVITNDGKMGVGTTIPSADLTIKGALKITDGTEKLGYVLTANSDGTAYWAADTLSLASKNKFMFILNQNMSSIPQYDKEYVVQTNSSPNLANTIAGASLDASKGIITLPPGVYNICYETTMSTTFDFFSLMMHLNDQLFLKNECYTGGTGINTMYKSFSEFKIYFSYMWTRSPNSFSGAMSSYNPNVNSTINIERLPFDL